MDKNLELLTALNQCVADSFHGSEQMNYMNMEEPKVIGLNREKKLTSSTYPIYGIDDFSVKVYSTGYMCISYSADIHLKDAHSPTFEQEIDKKVQQILVYLEKEYKKKTGLKLRTKPAGDIDIEINTLSKIRNWIKAKKCYELLSFEKKEKSSERNDRFKKQVNDMKGPGFQ